MTFKVTQHQSHWHYLIGDRTQLGYHQC